MVQGELLVLVFNPLSDPADHFAQPNIVLPYSGIQTGFTHTGGFHNCTHRQISVCIDSLWSRACVPGH